MDELKFLQDILDDLIMLRTKYNDKILLGVNNKVSTRINTLEKQKKKDNKNNPNIDTVQL